MIAKYRSSIHGKYCGMVIPTPSIAAFLPFLYWSYIANYFISQHPLQETQCWSMRCSSSSEELLHPIKQKQQKQKQSLTRSKPFLLLCLPPSPGGNELMANKTAAAISYSWSNRRQEENQYVVYGREERRTVVLGGTPAPALTLDHLSLGLFLHMLMPQLGQYLSYCDSVIPDPTVPLSLHGDSILALDGYFKDQMR